jgi:adenosylcobinamide hydrolase
MKQFELVGEDVKLILKDNVLAVLSNAPLITVGSAFHNGGGVKKTRAIVNVEVLKSCSDQCLHDDPDAYIVNSARKFGLTESFVGMVTAAAVENFALVSKRNDALAVSVIATAADNEGNTCNFAESAGEAIKVQHIEGTINIIVVIDGNPTESCLVSSLITATEAKAAALKELDIRSRFSGDEATGTVTDSVVAAETGKGASIIYGGPASELGQLVGYCTRKAVKEAVMKGDECLPCRSVLSRLKEMHLPVERLAFELAKAKSLGADEKTIASVLAKALRSDPLAASVVIAAAKMAEDTGKGTVPPEFGQLDALSKRFGEFFTRQGGVGAEEYALVDLPLFLKDVLIGIVKNALPGAQSESLK